MKIIDEGLLSEYRTAGPCDVCGKYCRERCAHHIYSRGSGRLDIAINLLHVGLDAVTDCPCHGQIHAGKVPLESLLEIASKIHGVPAGFIEGEVNRLRAMSKPTTTEAYADIIADHLQRVDRLRTIPEKSQARLFLWIDGAFYLVSKRPEGWSLTKTKNGELVKVYEITADGCECEDHLYRRRVCKHIGALRGVGLI